MTARTPTLSTWQAGALRRYAKDFERASSSSFSRLEAADDLRAARAALAAAEYAVVDFVAVRGKSVLDLAVMSGRKVADLAALLSSAASKLASHYEKGASRD